MISAVNWADNRLRMRQGGTAVDNRVVVPIMQTIVDVVPNVEMNVFVGNNDGDGGGRNNGRDGDACL